MKGGFKWLMSGAIIIVALIAASSLQLGDSLVYFYTPTEAVAKATELNEKTIKIGGMVRAGSVQNNTEKHEVNFVLTDLDKIDIKVTYLGVPPDMFKENQGVVVEGKIDPAGQSFQAKTLLVKHSEEYKKPDGSHTMDKELLQKSLFQQ